jgi:hypothetical protein
MSGKETPDPEKEIMAAEQDIDIEKQAQCQDESEQTAKPKEEVHDPNIVEFDGPVRLWTFFKTLRYSMMLVSDNDGLYSNIELA